MSSLHDRLSADLKQAMKARDQLRMDTIRMIKAALFNKEFELKKELDEAEMSRVLTTLVKQRKESAEQYQKAKRYADVRVMLEKEKGIDGVVIATPDHFHAVAANAAMQAGNLPRDGKAKAYAGKAP